MSLIYGKIGKKGLWPPSVQQSLIDIVAGLRDAYITAFWTLECML